MFNPKTKEERLEVRKIYLDGYDVQNMPGGECVVATSERNGSFYLMIFDGTAAKPAINCCYRSAESRQRAIEYHVENRKKRLQYKAERKQAQSAAGKYCIDESKPYFEVGQEYFCNCNYDGDSYTIFIKIIKRTACFVSYVRVYANREDDKIVRAKVQVDQNGEYISSNYDWFRACNRCATAEEIAEVKNAKQKEFDKQAEAQRKRELLELEAIKVIVEQNPIKAGDEYTIKIEWIEGLPETCEYMDGRILSVVAAEKIFFMVDNARKNGPGYDKWKFEILQAGQANPVWVDRYDMGDDNGGLIKFMSCYLEGRNTEFAEMLLTLTIMAASEVIEQKRRNSRVLSTSGNIINVKFA